MELKVYSCLDDRNVLDKKSLTLLLTTTFHLKENTDIINPTFIIASRNSALDSVISSINYLYCKSFGRYYFVNNIRLLRGGLIELECEVDVLNSNKDAIKKLNGIVNRSEKFITSYIVDEKMLLTSKKQFTVHNATDSPFKTSNLSMSNSCIALTVTGGV